MSLTKLEREELGRYRARDKANNKFSWALTKGAILSFVFTWLTRAITPNTVVWRPTQTFGIFVCITMGILSSYYGPFKEKKKGIEE